METLELDLRLSDEQIEVLRVYGLNYLKFAYLKQDYESYTFLEIPTGKVITLRR